MPESPSSPILVVVGNPQAASRTATAGRAVGDRLASISGAPVELIELAELGPALLGWGDPAADALKARVLAASALVVASPTYKAAYTGLTKLFLDRFDKDQLAGTPTVAFMTGGSAAHSLAVDVHLTPVLVEIGASCPARGLYLYGDQLDAPDGAIDAWFTLASGPLGKALA